MCLCPSLKSAISARSVVNSASWASIKPLTSIWSASILSILAVLASNVSILAFVASRSFALNCSILAISASNCLVVTLSAIIISKSAICFTLILGCAQPKAFFKISDLK